jgi:predicted small lipoprotein YifL
MRTARLAGPLLLALVLLASCGKKGSPNAPGPANEITYPRTYPSR